MDSGEDTGPSAPLLVNELMADNVRAVLDDTGAPSDWLELYNPGEVALDLGGYFLSDDWTEPGAAPLPAGTLLPGRGYLLLWASGDPDAGDEHLGFRLSAQGEGVGVFEPDGSPVDWVEFPPLAEDHAWARLPDGAEVWEEVPHGTPGAPNARMAQQAVLAVELGATWRYHDRGEDLGTAWREPAYDDSDWASGPAPLGYGDAQTTVLSYGGDAESKHPTTYFRLGFELEPGVAESIQEATLRLVVDDGAVVWLGGEEVARLNMGAGEVSWSSWASATVSGSAETTPVSLDLGPLALVEGLNVLAVEVHQAGPTSSDLTLDLSLELAAWVPEP